MLPSLFKIGVLKLLNATSFFQRRKSSLSPHTIEKFSQHISPATKGIALSADDKKHPQAFRLNRPLRVRHIVDAGQQRYDAGRMVISGRMADVCAELERLAACEAAMS